ncbi:MAG: hypothetical protein HYW48_04680 [Deltaproteobacteria bacterium]|nr:hypothetical protein [Deltaproteobacteria bacterium]
MKTQEKEKLKTKIKGKVIETKGERNPHSFTIQSQDGEKYFAHLGDISDNENLLYNSSETKRLKEGEQVEFDEASAEPFKRAIRVRPSSTSNS